MADMDKEITLSKEEFEKLKKELGPKEKESGEFIIVPKKEFEKLKKDKQVYDAVFEYLARGLEEFAKKMEAQNNKIKQQE